VVGEHMEASQAVASVVNHIGDTAVRQHLGPKMATVRLLRKVGQADAPERDGIRRPSRYVYHPTCPLIAHGEARGVDDHAVVVVGTVHPGDLRDGDAPSVVEVADLVAAGLLEREDERTPLGGADAARASDVVGEDGAVPGPAAEAEEAGLLSRSGGGREEQPRELLPGLVLMRHVPPLPADGAEQGAVGEAGKEPEDAADESVAEVRQGGRGGHRGGLASGFWASSGRTTRWCCGAGGQRRR
jgi:hypothetical protein